MESSPHTLTIYVSDATILQRFWSFISVPLAYSPKSWVLFLFLAIYLLCLVGLAHSSKRDPLSTLLFGIMIISNWLSEAHFIIGIYLDR